VYKYTVYTPQDSTGTGEAGVKGSEFLDLVDDCFLIQWVKENTKGGGNMFDLVFTTEPGLIEDMEITAPVAG